MRRSLLLVMTALALALAPAGAPAATEAGLGVTIAAPSTFQAGNPITVQGQLSVLAALPVVLEFSRGLQGQQIDILVDGIFATSTQTNSEGIYTTSLTLGAAVRIRTIQAVAFRGTLLETRSRVITTELSRILIGLRVAPVTVDLAPGTSTRMTAIGEWDDGRLEDVSERATWTSSNPGIATVSNAAGERGRVTGQAPGTTSVSAALDERTATATVNVG